MAINLDPHVLTEQLPGKIDVIEENWFKKATSLMELVDAWAESEGTAQSKADAKALRTSLEGAQKFVKEFIGEPKDKISETGSLWGFVDGGKNMLIAMGEEV